MPGLGLRLVVGLAGMVSRKWPPAVGDDDSSTVWRFCASTDDVSQQSKSSAELRRSLRLIESDRRLWLLDNRRVLDEMGRMAFVKDEAIDENPPLDPRGYLESIETFRVAGSKGLVLLYGIVLTRVTGGRRPTSCMFGELDLLSSCARSRMKRATRNMSCGTKEATSVVDAPARNPSVVLPRASLLDKQISVATANAAARTQRTMPEPNNSPETVLASRLKEAKIIHDSKAITTDSNTDDIMAVIRVDDVGFELRSAITMLSIKRTVVADTANAPSTAEAQGRDMLIVLLVAAPSSCVRAMASGYAEWSKTKLDVLARP